MTVPATEGVNEVPSSTEAESFTEAVAGVRPANNDAVAETATSVWKVQDVVGRDVPPRDSTPVTVMVMSVSAGSEDEGWKK